MIDAVVDLSHWQPDPNFEEMKKGGIQAVILKATQGSGWVDPTFVGRLRRAERAGLLVGAYHFCDASPPIDQARHFLNLAGSVSVLALDIEENTISGGTVQISQVAEMTAYVQMATGRLPLVYIPRDGPSGTGAGLPNGILAQCPLWLPEYGNDPVPPPGWQNWLLWQFTDTAAVPGVPVRCDRSRFAGTVDELITWWGVQT